MDLLVQVIDYNDTLETADKAGRSGAANKASPSADQTWPALHSYSIPQDVA
jgi:hypothetical protein